MRRRFYDRSDLRALGLPWSKATINRMVAAGDFPKPLRFGGTNAAPLWPVEAVEEWIALHLEAHRADCASAG